MIHADDDDAVQGGVGGAVSAPVEPVTDGFAASAAGAVIRSALGDLREALEPLPNMALLRRCAGLRPGELTSVTAAAKHSLRAIAQRQMTFNDETTGHEKLLSTLVDALAPQLTTAVGIGADNAAELLLSLGDNAGRLRTEAAFAKLCGACPIPASGSRLGIPHDRQGKWRCLTGRHAHRAPRRHGTACGCRHR